MPELPVSSMDHTREGELSVTFRRPVDRFKLVGVLTLANVTADTDFTSFRIHCDELVIGRGVDNGAVIPDTSVSRRHARIRCVENEFVIDDLESLNGTYVDGVPVVSCMLRGGDEVQIGRYLFFFDRLMEPTSHHD
jgi:FHA domain